MTIRFRLTLPLVLMVILPLTAIAGLAQSAVPETHQALVQTISAQDTALFDAVNRCDMARVEPCLPKTSSFTMTG